MELDLVIVFWIFRLVSMPLAQTQFTGRWLQPHESTWEVCLRIGSTAFCLHSPALFLSKPVRLLPILFSQHRSHQIQNQEDPG